MCYGNLCPLLGVLQLAQKHHLNWCYVQEFFDPGLQIFQKTPVTVLEELFPKRAVYSWAVARNYGCADLFRCRVTVPNCTGNKICIYSHCMNYFIYLILATNYSNFFLYIKMCIYKHDILFYTFYFCVTPIITCYRTIFYASRNLC